MITDKGEKHNKTKVNFHEPKKEKIKEAVPIKISTKTLPKPSPRPSSIYSNWAWIFVANSKTLVVSNHPCSCDKIKLKYFFWNYINILN